MKKINHCLHENSFYFLIGLTILFTSFTYSQDNNFDLNRDSYHEAPEDPYLPLDRKDMQRSPGYRFRSSPQFTVQVNVDGAGNNMMGDAANETSIAVDPTNPNRIVIGWRQFDNVASNFRQAGNAYSLDGGETWTFPGPLDPGVFRSDPVLDFDADGNFYYNSLRGTLECDVYKIIDGGTDWGSPFPANGGDKQWMRIDRTNGMGAGHNYSSWNSSFSTCEPGFFTRSTDGSNTFENCVLIDGDPFWGTLAVDADGTVYVSGRNNSELIVVKSTNAKDESMLVSWDSFASVDLDGSLDLQTPVNPAGLMGQLWVDVDISNGPGHGNVYTLASVQRFSNTDPADVMFARSVDGGNSFEPPIRINTDSGTSYQWFGTMSVAPNGRIDVVWLDTRDAPGGTNDSVLYYSFSNDQGDSWSDNIAISIAFDPNIGYPNQNKMGDYFDMVSDNNYAHLAWANTINGEQDAYYTRIDPITVLSLNDLRLNDELKFVNYPNPFSSETNIDFYIQNESQVKVMIFDVSGKKINTLMDKIVTGSQSLTWDGSNESGAKVSSGLYFISVVTSDKKTIAKLILE